MKTLIARQRVACSSNVVGWAEEERGGWRRLKAPQDLETYVVVELIEESTTIGFVEMFTQLRTTSYYQIRQRIGR